MGRDEKKHPEPKVRTVNGSAQGDKVEQEMMSLEAHGRQKKKKKPQTPSVYIKGKRLQEGRRGDIISSVILCQTTRCGSDLSAGEQMWDRS